MYATPWEMILQHLRHSIRAEQIFCSLTTEMKWLPTLANQPELAAVHKQNYETSYHMNTAAGNLLRLNRGWTWTDEDQTRLVVMTVECLLEAYAHLKQAAAAMSRLIAADPQATRLLQAARHWHKQRKYWLRQATHLLRKTVTPNVWEQGVHLVERAG